MNVSNLTLSKKYARAFLNFYQNELDAHEIKRLEEFALFINARKRVLFYVQLVYNNLNVKKDALRKLIENFNVPPSIEKLMQLLIIHKRLSLLPDIIFAIVKLYTLSLGIMEFTVASTYELDQEALLSIHDFLTRATGKRIILTTVLDEKLIAGIKITSDTLGWEHSARKQIRGLGLR